METLEKLFGGVGRIKIMRLFLFNPGRVYDREAVSIRAKVVSKAAQKEISYLEKLGLIERKKFVKEAVVEKETASSKKAKKAKKKAPGWILNSEFPYLQPLQKMLIDLNTLRHEEIVRKINTTGKISLIVLAGIFIENPESRVDLLVVGDKVNKGDLEAVVKNLEAEIGKEIRYTSFESPDFRYRISMYDKLVRDILDFPHKKVLNKLGV